MQIQSQADYDRLDAEAGATFNSIMKKAMAQKWPWRQLIETSANAELAHYQAVTDFSNPVAIAIEREKNLSEDNAKKPVSRLVKPGEYPELEERIRHKIEELNKHYGVDYPMPSIVIKKNLRETSQGSPAAYSIHGDVIEIDPVLLQQDTDVVFPTIAHELRHRYQRKPEQLLADLEITLAGQFGVGLDVLDPKILAIYRQKEADADLYAIQSESPDAALKMVDSTFMVTGSVFYQYIQEQLHTSDHLRDIITTYNKLSLAQQQTMQKTFLSLPPEPMDAVFNRALESNNKFENVLDHPSYKHRRELALHFKEVPADLARTDIQVDDHAQLIDQTTVEAAGAQLSNQLLQKPQGQTPPK